MAAEGKDGEGSGDGRDSYLFSKIHPSLTPLWDALELKSGSEDLTDFAIEYFVSEMLSPVSRETRLGAVSALSPKTAASYSVDEVEKRYAPLFDGSYDHEDQASVLMHGLVNALCKREPDAVSKVALSWLQDNEGIREDEPAPAPILTLPSFGSAAEAK